jgi:hypothetical protein
MASGGFNDLANPRLHAAAGVTARQSYSLFYVLLPTLSFPSALLSTLLLQHHPPKPRDRCVDLVRLHKREVFVTTFAFAFEGERSFIHRGWEFIERLRDQGRRVCNKAFSLNIYEPPIPFIPHHFEIAAFHRRCRGKNDGAPVAAAAAGINGGVAAGDAVLGAASGELESGWASGGVNSVLKSIFRWGKVAVTSDNGAVRDDGPGGGGDDDDDDDDMDTCEEMPPEPQPGPEPSPSPTPGGDDDDDVQALLEGLL